MSENDLKAQRKYITDLIKNQLKIFRLNGKSNQEVTLSLPKVTSVNKTLVKTILEEILKYKPDIINYQELKCMDSSIMILTIVLK
jgi:hypothetical protein